MAQAAAGRRAHTTALSAAHFCPLLHCVALLQVPSSEARPLPLGALPHTLQPAEQGPARPQLPLPPPLVEAPLSLNLAALGALGIKCTPDVPLLGLPFFSPHLDSPLGLGTALKAPSESG